MCLISWVERGGLTWKACFETGALGKPRTADKPGEENSGSKGLEFPTRFFARDFAGNRLEFSL